MSLISHLDTCLKLKKKLFKYFLFNLSSTTVYPRTCLPLQTLNANQYQSYKTKEIPFWWWHQKYTQLECQIIVIIFRIIFSQFDLILLIVISPTDVFACVLSHQNHPNTHTQERKKKSYNQFHKKKMLLDLIFHHIEFVFHQFYFAKTRYLSSRMCVYVSVRHDRKAMKTKYNNNNKIEVHRKSP